MSNLIRMEFYKLRHNLLYWLALLALLFWGFTGAQEYIDFASYNTVGWDDIAVTSFSGLYNSMTADCLFLVSILAGVISFTTGREFSLRTLSSEVASGLNRRDIFISKAIVNILAFDLLMIAQPLGGIVKGIQHYGVGDLPDNILNVLRTSLYIFIIYSAVFMFCVLIAYLFRNGIVAGIVSAVFWFVLLYVFAILCDKDLNAVKVLPLYHSRKILDVGSSLHGGNIINIPAILCSVAWVSVCSIITWRAFKKADLK